MYHNKLEHREILKIYENDQKNRNPKTKLKWGVGILFSLLISPFIMMGNLESMIFIGVILAFLCFMSYRLLAKDYGLKPFLRGLYKQMYYVLFEEHTIEIQPDGMIITAQSEERGYAWASFEEVYSWQDCIVCVTQGQLGKRRELIPIKVGSKYVEKILSDIEIGRKQYQSLEIARNLVVHNHTEMSEALRQEALAITRGGKKTLYNVSKAIGKMTGSLNTADFEKRRGINYSITDEYIYCFSDLLFQKFLVNQVIGIKENEQVYVIQLQNAYFLIDKTAFMNGGEVRIEALKHNKG